MPKVCPIGTHWYTFLELQTLLQCSGLHYSIQQHHFFLNNTVQPMPLYAFTVAYAEGIRWEILPSRAVTRPMRAVLRPRAQLPGGAEPS